MRNPDHLYQKIDNIIAAVDSHVVGKEFKLEANARKAREVPSRLTDKELLKIFVRLVAFSGQAPSDKVKEVLDSNIFYKMFKGYNVAKVAVLNPCDLVDQYWDKISPIRYQAKVFQIVMFARRILRIGSLASLLIHSDMPVRIRKQKDIDAFWAAFKAIQDELYKPNRDYCYSLILGQLKPIVEIS